MKEKESMKLKALSDIASIDINLEFDTILQRILKITCKTINAHSGTIMLIHDDTEELRMVSSHGLPENYIGMVYEAAEKAGVTITSSPSGDVLKTGNYYLVPNISEEPRDEPWYELSKRIGFSAQIFTPMKRGSKVIGLLNVYMREIHDFTDEEIDFVTIAASQASSVVQNARMCMKLKKNIHELDDYKRQLEGKIKETHNALYESEARYRDIFENAEDPMYTLDLKGFIVSVNKAGMHQLVCMENEIIGTNISTWLTPECFKLVEERYKKIYLGEPLDQPFIIEVICKNGEHKWGEVRTSLIRQGNKIIGTHGISRDVTEKVRLERLLKESEAKHRELFENAEDPMYTHDLKGFFLSINKAGLRHLGCMENEVIGTHISKWLTPESYKLVEDRIKKIHFGEPLDQPVIIEVICKNGEHKWGEVRTSLIRQGNKIIGTHGIARDVTEKKRLEQELRESELRYRDMFDNAQDPMFTIDINGSFLAINNAGLDVLDVKKDEIIGTNLSSWLTKECMEEARYRLAQITRGESLGAIIYEMIRKDGKHIWVEIKGRPIIEGNEIKCLHGIARDVTEKVSLEQKVKDYHRKLEKSYEELIEADRVKTEFISNMTHELLTPLTSIRGFAELLDDETMGDINAEQKKSLDIILRNSERLIRLIKELLDSSNLENNKLGLQFRLVSINNILSKSIQDIYPQANDKQIYIIKDIPPLPEVWGDEERLMQVITNLLMNAIKFTPQKGKITIRGMEDIEHIKISITDTGIGIPSDKLKTIFDRFYQVDGSSSRKYGGIGLGLSICKNIIHKHYGQIWAESDGHGSTFQITLPKLKSNLGEKHV